MPRDRVEYIWDLMIKLREEIISRQKVRVQIYGFKIAILTLLFAYIGSTEIAGSNPIMNKTGIWNLIGNSEVPILIILLPAITSVLLDLITLNQDYGIKRIGFFSREFLEPAIRRELKWPEDELLWEEYMRHPDLRTKFGILGNIGTTIVVYIFILFIYFRYMSDKSTAWDHVAIPESHILICILILFFLIDLYMIYKVRSAFGSQFKENFWSTYNKSDDCLINKHSDTQTKEDS